ncbi:MAG: hypothetical protein NZ890_22765 [Myxococcota bacterium]|nr:hypothetical protein [Myxococcota bacterium]
MMLLRRLLWSVLVVALLGGLGALLGADCLVLGLISLLTLVGLLHSIMAHDSSPPHSIR